MGNLEDIEGKIDLETADVKAVTDSVKAIDLKVEGLYTLIKELQGQGVSDAAAARLNAKLGELATAKEALKTALSTVETDDEAEGDQG